MTTYIVTTSKPDHQLRVALDRAARQRSGIRQPSSTQLSVTIPEHGNPIAALIHPLCHMLAPAQLDGVHIEATDESWSATLQADPVAAATVVHVAVRRTPQAVPSRSVFSIPAPSRRARLRQHAARWAAVAKNRPRS